MGTSLNVLLLGSGGREHALAWKLAQSPLLGKLFVAPGNAGTANEGINLPVSVDDFDAIKKTVLEQEINMVIVGPENPLVNGIADYFKIDPELTEVSVIGPDKEGSQLEESKEFAKEFMQRHSIPTASYRSFSNETLADGLTYLETVNPPYVIKADGLAAGKGVVILDDLEAAKKELQEMIRGAKFGDASAKVVIEEFLDGIELSVFVLTDGKSYCILPEAKDYKQIGEGDTGLNTGGMGAVSPVPFADEEFMRKVEEQIIKPTVQGLRTDAIDYNGFIFFGLINVLGDPYVIEYNVRMGDPETEVVIPRIKSDLLELFIAVSEKKLQDKTIDFDEQFTVTVMAVSGGYPGSYEKGKSITGLEDVDGSILFHAGTSLQDGELVTSGGRVIAITSQDVTIEDALAKSYHNAGAIQFESKYYRKDIGFDLELAGSTTS